MKRKLTRLLAILMALLFIPVIPIGGQALIVSADETQPVRQEIDFNANWKFLKSDAAGAQAVDFDDSSWMPVGLPHSTGYTTYEYSNNYSGAGPQAYIGIYWYRKTIVFPQNVAGKQIYLNFGAAMQVATVYVNGEEVGSHSGGWMGFTFDITQAKDVQQCITNQIPIVIAVKCDSRRSASIPPGRTSDPDFQYHSGLYRGAKLIVNEKIHITDTYYANATASGGVFIHSDATHNYTNANANMGITNFEGTAADGTRTGIVSFWIGAHVRNASSGSAAISVKNELYDPDGAKVWEATSSTATVPSGSSQQITMTTGGSNPAAPRLKLWHPNHPYLYTLKTFVYAGGVLVDETETRTGFRHISFSNTNATGGATRANKIVINGENWFGLGTNTHQEIGMVGFAVTEDAVRDEVRLIKDAGYDFIRLAHYPYQRAFIEACDEYGVMVQQPITGWQTNFTTNTSAAEISYQEARDMIRRDRNSPSVVAWELSINEGGMSAAFVTNMQNLGRGELPTRQMIMAGNNSYEVRYLHSDSTTTGGAYPQFYFEYGDWQYGGYSSSTRHVRWNASEDKTRIPLGNFQAALDRANNSVINFSFYWVWQDYTGFGEGSPDTRYPNVGSGGNTSNTAGYPIPCGMVDMYRIPKYAYYYAQSQRSASTKFYGIDGVRSGYMVHIGTRWFDTTPVKAGETAVTDVPVFTNAPYVKLYGSTDGQTWTQVGTTKTSWDASRPANNSGTSYAQTVAYSAGTTSRQWTFSNISHTYTWLKAVALANSSGTESDALAEYIVRDPSSAQANKIDLTWQSDWNSNGTKSNRVRPLIANGGDKRLLYISILDDKGMIKSDSGLVTTARTLSAAQFSAAGLTNSNPVTLTVKSGDALLLGGDIAAPAGSTANNPGAPGFTSVVATPRGGQVSVWVVAGSTANDTIVIEATSPGLQPAQITLGTVAKDGFWPVDVDVPLKPITDFCIARAKPSTASSGNAALANDGDDETIWETASANAGEWWQVDLQNSYTLSDISILWGELEAYKYKIEFSRTGETGSWQTLFDMSGNTVAEEETVLRAVGTAKIARYIRLTFTTGAVGDGFSVIEIHMNGTILSENTNVVLTGMPAWWQDESMGLTPALQGCDGNPASSATAANAGGGNQWVCDFEAIYDITGVSITWEKEYAYKYKLEFSTDNKTWSTALFKSRNTTEAATIDIFATAIPNARYMRVTSVPDAEPMSFNLMSVFGTDAKDLAFEKTVAGTGSTVTVDLAGKFSVRGVRVEWPDDEERAYEIQTSPDGVAWYGYFAGSTDAFADVHTVTAHGAQYVRLVGAGIADIEALNVYGEAIAVKGLAPGDNALENPSFATLPANSTNTITGWSKLPDTVANAVYGNTSAGAQAAGTDDTRYAYFSNGTAGAYSASLYQTVTGLPDGLYEFGGWVRRGPNTGTAPLELYAYVENYGGETKAINLLTDVAVTNAAFSATLSAATYPYRYISIGNIHVTNGKASVGFFMNSASATANYLFIDELHFKLIELDPPVNVNGSASGALYISKNGANVIGDYTFRNNSSTGDTAQIILAAYRNGKLAEIKLEQMQVAPGEVARGMLTMPSFDPALEYKAFLWDGLYIPIISDETLGAKSVETFDFTIMTNGTVTLPLSAKVYYNNGPHGVDTAAVTWDPLPALDTPGTYTVFGAVEGTSIQTKAVIVVNMMVVTGNLLLRGNARNSYFDSTTGTTNYNGTGWVVPSQWGSPATGTTEARNAGVGATAMALKYWINAAPNASSLKAYLSVTPSVVDLPFIPAGQYRVDCYARTGSTTSGQYYQLYATVGTATQTLNIANTNTWTLRSVTITIPEGTTSFEIGIQVTSTNIGTGAWGQFDDFAVTYIG